MTAAINTASVPATVVAFKGRKSSKKSDAAKAAHLSVIENLKASYVAPTLVPLSEQRTPEEEDARSAPALAAMTAPAIKTPKAKATKAGKTATPAPTKSPTKATKPVVETKVKTPATKPTKAKAEPKEKVKGGLRKAQVRILEALKKAGKALSRKEIAEKAPADLAWLNAWIGSHNEEIRAKNDAAEFPCLLTLKLVRYVPSAEEGKLHYEITSAGKEELETIQKAAK